MEIKINGLITVDGMKFHDVEGGFGEGKKSMLVKEIAGIHQRLVGDVNKLINNNRIRFKDNIDIIDLNKEEFAMILSQSGIYTRNSINASSNIYLLSERGYSKLLKIMDDDLAWDKYDELVDNYFNMREQLNKRPKLPSYSEALRQLADKIDENDRLKKDNEQKNKVINTFSTSDGDILVRELAKIMSKDGYKIGEKKLWQKLRDIKLVNQKNEPYQQYIDMEIFTIKEGTKNNHIYRTVKVTPKGQVYIINKIKNNI